MLTERFPDTVETQPEMLAHHYNEAGLSKLAVVYWQWAGDRGHTRSAHQEAISYLDNGLKVLETLPETPDGRDRGGWLKVKRKPSMPIRCRQFLTMPSRSRL
ncbi:MAG: hypothetical protein O7G88_19995 [bacterium]|nr:hypothetical protein [bacterium]